MVDRYTVSRDQMRYTFTLRDGLQFHDGQPVTAQDCVASILRWGRRDGLGRLLLAATGKLDASDRKTFVLELKGPFGLVIEALGKPSSNVPFIMPARLAATPETEQVKDPIGSGPYRFVKEEWQPGHQVVYERNPHYVPRGEPPSGAAGGKHVYLDRVVWRYIPDPATVSAALEAGEIDFWSFPPLDFVARLERNPNLTTFVGDPVGLIGMIRPNHLHPPFHHKKARQALLWAVNQETFLQGAIGQPKYYRPCPSIFRPQLHGAALVTREVLTRLGVAVDLQAMDWSTLLSRRAKKEPPREGGWNLFCTNWIAADVMTPAVNAAIAGTCDRAWFGWYCSERMERLRAEWVRATDPARRKELAVQIQLLAYDEVPFVLWGQYVQPHVFAKRVRGVLRFATPVVWNVWLEG